MKWWRLKQRNADLERELQSDLELEQEEQRDRGLPPEEARYAARRAFGNPVLIRDQTRQAWRWAPFERLFQDLRFALRQCVRNPRFTAVCFLTLALGIGAQTTIYSVIHAVLIDPYPYRGAMRMVHIHLYDKDPDPYDLALDEPQFDRFLKSPVLDGAMAEDVYTMALTGGDLPEQLQVGRMSTNAFAYFGVPALLGRTFGPTDGPQLAVLSHTFWISHFAGRAGAIGQPLQLDHRNYAIVGVMPSRFAWMGSDVYVPLPHSTNPRRPVNVYARLRAGVSDRQAEQALEPMLDSFARDTPWNFPQRFKVHVVHINQVAIGRFRGFLVVLFLSVSLLLVLACVNVAILLLARGESRQSEIAMRKALGAAPTRILRQLLTESLLLALGGGALGVLFAFAGIRLVHALIRPLPSIFPPEARIALNVPVLVFSVGIAACTGIVFGLWPALRLSRSNLRHPAEGAAYKLAGSAGARKAHFVLLASEVALTILLMAASGATVQKLLQLLHTNLGYNPHHLARVNFVLPEHSHDDWADRVQYQEQIRRAVAADPNIVSAAIGELPPNILDSTPVSIPGLGGVSGYAIAQQVGPRYFSTLGVPLLRGRLWTPAEASHAVRLALINQSMRRRYWPRANPIGQTVVLNNGVASGNVWKLVAPGDDQRFQIIGVVGDAPNKGLGESVAPAVFIPYSMTPYDGFDVVFRTRGNPADLLHSIKENVHRIAQGQAVGNLITANELLEGDTLGRERFVARLFSGFALLGLAFAVCGLYSIQSYLVTQRTRELGVRIALGAGRAHIVGVVSRACAMAVLAGSAIGVLSSIAFSRAFAFWTGADVRAPEMLAAVLVVLLLAAAAAAVGPALTAASVDPVRALRTE